MIPDTIPMICFFWSPGLALPTSATPMVFKITTSAINMNL